MEAKFNMEGASHIQMKGRSLFKSVDMFDFFIQHLSWYERRLDSDPAIKGTVTARLKHQTRTLTGVDNTGLGGPFEKNSYHNPLRQKNGQVLVVMPFYGAGKGSGNSDFSARATYLNITVLSLYEIFPNIVISVGPESDYNYVAYESGLPLYDVMATPWIVKPSALGFATIISAQRRFTSGAWKGFDFVCTWIDRTIRCMQSSVRL